MSSAHSNGILKGDAEGLANVTETLVLETANYCWEDYAFLEETEAISTAVKTKKTNLLEMAFSALQDDDLDFMALFASDGSLLWSSYTFTASADFTAYAGDTYMGLFSDDTAGLCTIYIATDEETGAVCVIGRSMLDNALVQSVKSTTNAESSIYYGETSYNTTFTDANGEQIIGEQMPAAASKAVYGQGKPYIGKMKIRGENYYVCYKPACDIDGNVVAAYFSALSAKSSDTRFLTIIIAVIVASVVIIAASFFVAMRSIRRLVDKPILEADRLATEMTNASFSKPDPAFSFTNDEVGDFVKKLRQTKKGISTYIKDISDILRSMGEGDFSRSSALDYVGDFAEIQHSFGEIEVSLAQIIGNMDASANGVQRGAEEIAEGSQTLAEGTTRQATAIEELNSTIANISAQITATSENAGRANSLSEGCLRKVDEQNEQMNSMLEAMDEIREKSAKISAIISTIENIAFQTNILSLNASVEAARAGAAGKGFAVVADEVRTLAAKSSDAASSTKTLIVDTVKAVNDGAELAQKTADILKEVIEQTQQTNAIIGEINTAAAAQAEAVTQVSQGISEISGVTQQNSATAEETAASCQTLATQSNMLKQQVSRFKV
jgi:methyl-accepting chemotaxis protein